MKASFPKTLAVFALSLAILAGMSGAHAEGLYVGGGLAVPHYNEPVNGIGSSGGDGVGLKLFGGWQFTPNFAVESGYFDLGSNAKLGGSARARGLYVDGVGSVSIAPQWSLSGSVGLADGQLRTSAGNDSSAALKLGVAVQYELTPRTALRLGYEQYRFANAFDSKPKVGQTALSVRYGF